MFNGEKVLDIHGHHSTPAQFRAYAYNLIALRTPMGSGLTNMHLHGARRTISLYWTSKTASCYP